MKRVFLISNIINSRLDSQNSRINAIEQFLGGTNFIKDDGDNIKNYYFGLTGNPPADGSPNSRWKEISNNSIWRQFL